MSLLSVGDTGAGSPKSIHPLVVLLSDRELSQMAATTWRCSHCGHLERHDDPRELRIAACFHNQQHLGGG
jgi:hypothetical protein